MTDFYRWCAVLCKPPLSIGAPRAGAAFRPFVALLCGVAVLLLASSPTIGSAAVERRAPFQPPKSKANGNVVASNAWARPALKGGTGGAYMTITNNSHSVIRILSATCACAGATELHVSTVHDGKASMQMLPKLIVTPGATVSLKPGGMHFMLIGLRKAFVKGDTARLTMHLENGGHVAVDVAVRAQ